MGSRLGARVLDWLILLVIFGVVFGLLAVLIGVSGGFRDFSSDSSFESSNRSDDVGGALVLGFGALAYLITAIYEIGLVATRGATLGKQVVGIKVVREADGQIPGFLPAFLRWLLPFAASFVCTIGAFLVWLSPFFDSSGRIQGWHDKMAKTVVIRP
jgi:uncharacterized RDD family membrane protein YckC